VQPSRKYICNRQILPYLLGLSIVVISSQMYCCAVDKKEQQDHKDPVKELADSALQPYRRP